MLFRLLKRLPLNFWVTLFVGLLALLLAGPMWRLSGIPAATADADFHLHRSAAVYRAFEQGIFWPRWFPIVYNGLGAPVLHHYSPGFYWLVASIHAGGIGLDHAVKLAVTAAVLLSGFGAYAWLRYAFSPVASLTGAGLYLLHPHILTRQLYFEGSYPHLLALLLLPVCLYAFTALHMQPRLWNWVLAVVSSTSLIFLHPKVALVGAVILAAYWLVLAVSFRHPPGLIRCLVSAMLAGLLSSAFWLPAVIDLDYVQIDNARVGFFHFSQHFYDWRGLFLFQSPFLDSRAGNPLIQLIFLGFGAASWLTLAAGLASLSFVKHRRRRYWGIGGALYTLAMLFLTLRASEPLWETIPGLSMFQFPFRFLTFAPLGLLPVAAMAVDALPVGRRWLAALSLAIVSFLSLFPYLFPSHTSPMLAERVQTLTAQETLLYEKTSKAYGTTGASDEFLVQGADMEVVTGRKPEPEATLLAWRSPHEAVADLAGQTEPMLLRMHFHPGWSAGRRAELSSGPAGWMQVTELANPAQPLVLRWHGTTPQRWGERLSLLGLLASFSGLFLIAVRRGRGVELGGTREPLTSPDSLHVRKLVACVLAVVIVGFAIDRSERGPFWWNSPAGQLAFPVEGQPVTLEDADFGRLTLLGWQLMSSETPKPGGLIRVRLYWQGRAEGNARIHTFLHLYSPLTGRSWAVENWKVDRPEIWWWDPEKYYIDDVHLFLPDYLPPTTFSLGAGLFTHEKGKFIVTGTNDNIVHLSTFDFAPSRPGLFQKERPTTKARAATDDGLLLQGYDLSSHLHRPTLGLFWDSGNGIANDWITYIHLHDPSGERIAQFDGPALDGLVPTSQWHTNALYIDRRVLDLPLELAPGNYLLRIGLYDRSTGERLPFHPEDGTQRYFADGQLLVPLAVLPQEEASE